MIDESIPATHTKWKKKDERKTRTSVRASVQHIRFRYKMFPTKWSSNFFHIALWRATFINSLYLHLKPYMWRSFTFQTFYCHSLLMCSNKIEFWLTNFNAFMHFFSLPPLPFLLSRWVTKKITLQKYIQKQIVCIAEASEKNKRPGMSVGY